MKTTEYFKTLLDTQSSNSTKSFVLMISSIVSAVVNLSVCFILIYDVVTNGYVKTSLWDAGFFVLCTGGYMAGSGLTKAIVDRYRARKTRMYDIAMETLKHDSEGNIDKEE